MTEQTPQEILAMMRARFDQAKEATRELADAACAFNKQCKESGMNEHEAMFLTEKYLQIILTNRE